MRSSSIFLLILAATSVGSIASSQSASSQRTSYSTHTPARKFDFAIVTGDNNVSCWGNWDSNTFRDLRNRSKSDTIYVKKGDELYAITDRNLVAQAKAALGPMEKLGKQQGELGRQQGALGREQGKLGTQQGSLGRELGELGRGLSDEIRSGKADIQGRMSQVSKKMQELGRQQSELGKKQSALGGRQSELGRQQSQASKEAEDQIIKLIDDAFAGGLAKPVRK